MKVLLTATVQSHICQFHKPLVEILHESGYEVHVAAKNNLEEKNGMKLDFVDKIYDIPFARSPKSKDNIKAYKQLKKIIDKENYNIIHCNTPMGGIVTRIASRKARKNGTNVIYTAHGFHFYKGSPIKNWIIYYPIEKWMARWTDKLVTITDEDYQLASRKFPCSVYHVHGVGVKTQKYDSVTTEQANEMRIKNGWENSFLILCTGELNANKNQITLIKAMPDILKKEPNVKLLLAGNGPYEEKVKSTIQELGLKDKVKLLGYRTDLEWFVKMSDLCVSASFREGLPVNVLEAMYCCKPVVVSNNRGHRELIKSGVNGYIVETGETQGFSDKIIELIENASKREEFGKVSKEIVKLYTDTHVKEELKCIY